MIRVAVIQMETTFDLETNFLAAEAGVKTAHAAGAQLVVLPEEFATLAWPQEKRLAIAESTEQKRLSTFLSTLAKQYQLYLVGGTVPSKTEVPQKLLSTSLVYEPTGQCLAAYHKLHLFNAMVNDHKQVYEESALFIPGSTPVSIATPLGHLGLSICYDLRFPELYRHLSAEGAQFFTVPSAFTAVTGAAHWEVLLRARAIENQCFVLAANQSGKHGDGRETYGHSMIIDPWGRILAQQILGPGVVIADCDLTEQSNLRTRLPVLQHRRL